MTQPVSRPVSRPVTRRSALLALGGFGILVACSGKKSDTTSLGSPSPSAAATTTTSSSAPTCVLTPEATEGPYYVAGAPTRGDVREEQPGAPLALTIQVLDATSCQPISNADVEIWHANATGAYSGVQGNSDDWLRGHQTTDSRGQARFTTVYPGWYTGRAPHIHMKVHVGGNTVHTGQLFFNDATNTQVYSHGIYASRGNANQTNENDMIYQQAGGASAIVPVKQSGVGYAGDISVGVRRR